VLHRLFVNLGAELSR